jgi:hypothetical protein
MMETLLGFVKDGMQDLAVVWKPLFTNDARLEAIHLLYHAQHRMDQSHPHK